MHVQADFRHDFKALKNEECPLLDWVPGAVDYAYMHEFMPSWIPESLYGLTKASGSL